MSKTPDTHLSPDEVSRLRLALLRVARRLRQHAAGMTQSQLSALASVNRSGPLTISDLAAIENVQPPSVSRIVGALEGEGWVSRVADPRDGRSALVQCTDRGHRELARLAADRDAWLARRVASLSLADQQQIAAALPALERLFEPVESRPRPPLPPHQSPSDHPPHEDPL